jgi:hypothetical protein
MKYLKTFNENTLLRYNPTLTTDDSDIASVSVWRKILQVVAQTPVEKFDNVEDYLDSIVMDVLSQFNTPNDQIEVKKEAIIKRYGYTIKDYYLKNL